MGLIASLFVAFPTGDQQAKMVGKHQPVTLARWKADSSAVPWRASR